MDFLFELVFDVIFGLIGDLFSSVFHAVFPGSKGTRSRAAKALSAGGLPGHLSPQLKEFVQNLPRPEGDPLAVCVPVEPKRLAKVPFGLASLFPLWRCGEECFALWEAKGLRSYPEFGLFFSKKRKLRIMSFGGSEQGMLAVMLARVLEHQDWSDPESATVSARRAADATGYRFADETIQWFRERNEAGIYDREFDAEQFGKEIASRDQAA